MDQGDKDHGHAAGTGGTIAGRGAAPLTRKPDASGTAKLTGAGPAVGSPGAETDREQAQERSQRDAS